MFIKVRGATLRYPRRNDQGGHSTAPALCAEDVPAILCMCESTCVNLHGSFGDWPRIGVHLASIPPRLAWSIGWAELRSMHAGQHLHHLPACVRKQGRGTWDTGPLPPAAPVATTQAGRQRPRTHACPRYVLFAGRGDAA